VQSILLLGMTKKARVKNVKTAKSVQFKRRRAKERCERQDVRAEQGRSAAGEGANIACWTTRTSRHFRSVSVIEVPGKADDLCSR
jgi:hypothetical protein